ncbi:MAG: M48 family metalloprotease [Acidobacteriales bacterium]|nr:M48 family metalloprotease [Terriglobales bacterium]
MAITALGTRAQQPPAPTEDPAQDLNRVIEKQAPAPAHSFDEVIDRAINSERALCSRLKTKEPVIETYIQEVKKDTDLGYVPNHDYYFLGKLNITNGIVDNSFLPQNSMFKKVPHMFASVFTTEYYPGGFADEMFLDRENFDRTHYKFEFVKREFLGEVRCFVINIIPQPKTGKRHFEGRLWIEDQGYNIVRFNGRYIPSPNNEFTHFDSWRVNAGGLWLPTYIYGQEEGFRWGLVHTAPMRSQTRLWDYETSRDRAQAAFTELTVESPQGVRDESQGNTNGYSPVQAERMWETEAEENIIDRLRKAGLVAPASEVDQVLDTVLNNLEVTNNISMDPPIHARILLTTPLESVAVNHTILMSRGLVDVLPDEACLAAVLAHELAHISLGHSVNTKYAFADRLLFDDPAVLKKVSVARTQEEEQEADDKAIKMLKNSPYANQLPKVGLFLRMLSERSDDVPHLIKPLLGNRVSDTKKDLRMSGLMEVAPELQVRNKDQISALPLGSRITVNPWSDQLRLLKTQTMALSSAKEKMPFQVTPFMVYLTREGQGQNAPPAQQPSGSASTQPTPPAGTR